MFSPILFSAEPQKDNLKAKYNNVFISLKVVPYICRSQACSFATPAKSPKSKAQKKQDFVHACAVRATGRGIFSRYVCGRLEENEAGKRVKPVGETG